MALLARLWSRPWYLLACSAVFVHTPRVHTRSAMHIGLCGKTGAFVSVMQWMIELNNCRVLYPNLGNFFSSPIMEIIVK